MTNRLFEVTPLCQHTSMQEPQGGYIPTQRTYEFFENPQKLRQRVEIALPQTSEKLKLPKLAKQRKRPKIATIILLPERLDQILEQESPSLRSFYGALCKFEMSENQRTRGRQREPRLGIRLQSF